MEARMTLPAYAMNRASFPEMYEQMLVGPLFRPWVDELLDRAGLSPGDRVLDVACGTGIVARVAKERLGAAGRVVGVDVSPPMLAVARGLAPDIEWREGNAGTLPAAAGDFDIVCCQQGLQFFPDRPAAVREMRRVLAPGGRLAVSTWRPVEEVPLFHDLHRVAERHLGSVVDQRHAFGETAPLEALLRDAGFEDVRVDIASRTIRFDDSAVFIQLNTMAIVGMSPASKTMTDEERGRVLDEIVRDSADVARRYTDQEGFRFGITSNVATARA
jgi:ubiquinone/menaquinone biosynthesis C-methylase UbiE